MRHFICVPLGVIKLGDNKEKDSDNFVFKNWVGVSKSFQTFLRHSKKGEYTHTFT